MGPEISDGVRKPAGIYAFEDNFTQLNRAQQLASEHGLSLPQIALAYVLSQPLNIFALTGGATRDEVKANVEASDLTLSPTELDWLELKRESR